MKRRGGRNRVLDGVAGVSGGTGIERGLRRRSARGREARWRRGERVGTVVYEAFEAEAVASFLLWVLIPRRIEGTGGRDVQVHG